MIALPIVCGLLDVCLRKQIDASLFHPVDGQFKWPDLLAISTVVCDRSHSLTQADINRRAGFTFALNEKVKNTLAWLTFGQTKFGYQLQVLCVDCTNEVAPLKAPPQYMIRLKFGLLVWMIELWRQISTNFRTAMTFLNEESSVKRTIILFSNTIDRTFDLRFHD